jgi:hypothetical protein
MEKFGFKRILIEVDNYNATIVFRKHKRYIKILSTSYPTDYPYYYNIILGKGDSENFFEYDWNSVAVLRLAPINDSSITAYSYSFPYGDKVKFSVEAANRDLLKYGLSFLKGDLSIFYEARKKANEEREPYKISTADQNGVYQTTYESESVKQKKKYS